MFQNSAVTNPVDPNFSFSTVYLGGTTALTDAGKAVIAAVFQISMSDLGLLITKTNTTGINSSYIAALYRHAAK